MRRLRPISVVRGWRQWALLDREEMRRLTRSRWAQIKARLLEEERGQSAPRTRQEPNVGSGEEERP